MSLSATKICTAAIGFAFVLSACTTHIAPYKTKQRRFRGGDYSGSLAPGPNSLYAQGTNGFLEDNTASRVGDILVVVINEQEAASRDASTQLAKKDSIRNAVPNALGLMVKLKEKFPDVDPAALFGVTNDSAFDGSGKIERKGSLTATLPVRVRRLMPNGDLFVEGTKVVMVGHEEHHIYVSGLVRRNDITQNNTIVSSRIADAEIEYTGRGDVSDQQRRNWFSRMISKVWPF